LIDLKRTLVFFEIYLICPDSQLGLYLFQYYINDKITTVP